jgi:hypothetical protein
MSECIHAPNGDRRQTNHTVKFTILNPEALLTPEVARAVVGLLLSPNRESPPAGPVSTLDRKEAEL